MKHLSFLTVIVLLFGPHVAPPKKTSQSSDKPVYHPTGTEATIVGSIGVKGPIPKPRRIDMTADPVCIELNEKLNKQPETDSLITNEDRLVNAFIYVKGDSLAAYQFPIPDSTVTLERKNCAYSPHVVGMRVGQRLTVINSDSTQHNTHPTPKLNPEWNQTQPSYGPPIIQSFSREEVLIPFKCNQHPWEKAYVAVLKHPFFAVSDGFGNYEISGVPAGTYKLVAWHEQLGWQEVEISVSPNETRRADFDFDSNKRH